MPIHENPKPIHENPKPVEIVSLPGVFLAIGQLLEVWRAEGLALSAAQRAVQQTLEAEEADRQRHREEKEERRREADETRRIADRDEQRADNRLRRISSLMSAIDDARRAGQHEVGSKLTLELGELTSTDLRYNPTVNEERYSR